MADERVRVTYLQAPSYTAESADIIETFDECDWKSYQRETSEAETDARHYTDDDIDTGGVAGG